MQFKIPRTHGTNEIVELVLVETDIGVEICTVSASSDKHFYVGTFCNEDGKLHLHGSIHKKLGMSLDEQGYIEVVKG